MVSLSELAKSLDSSDMLGHIRNFPSDLSTAWDKSESWDLASIQTQTFTGVLCLGMGGSASGGDFLSCLSDADGCLPFVTHRGYDLPAWVSENWLVLATSYSGNTEETLDAVEAAIGLGCAVVGLSSGGALQSSGALKIPNRHASASWVPKMWPKAERGGCPPGNSIQI